MSAPLQTQIRDYFFFVDEEQGAVDITAMQERQIVDPVRPIQPPVAPRRARLGWLVGVAAAAVTIAILLPLLLFSSSTVPDVGTDTPVATTPPTTPPTSLATPPTAPPSSVTWSRVPHDADIFGEARMASVVVGGPGLVAVGSAPPNPDAPRVDGVAAVWTSTDGIAWSRVPHDEAVFGGEGDQWMTSVIVGGPGLLAFGTDEGRVRRAALWASVDGLNWTRVPHDEALYAAGEPRSVVAGGPGFVGVAEIESAATVWTSTDGLTWTRVPHDEAVFGLALGDGNAMTAVTTGGPGFVAVGSDGLNSDAPTGRARAVVWTSVDGLSWSRLAHDEAVFGGEGDQGMFDVTAGGPGLVAVGEDEQGAPVWTSADGITWSRIPHDQTAFIGIGVRIFDVFNTGGQGLLAFGDDSAGAVVWTSADGITWSRVPRDETVISGIGVQISEAIVGGPGLVAVGSEGSDAAVWVAVPED